MNKLYMVLIALLAASAIVAQTARVQVIHNSPTPGTEAGPIVDIYVNGALLPELTAVPFRAATPFLDVPAGADIEVGVAVSPSTSVDEAIATFPLGSLDDGGRYVVIAAGIVGDADNPFNLFVNAAAREAAMMPDNVDFSVFHGSPGAPAVDVDARTVGNLISNLAFGSFTDDYLSVPANEYYLDVRAAGTPGIVATFLADLNGLGGGAAQVFASGILGGTPAFGLFAALPDGTVAAFPFSPVARVQILHNSPAPSVDLYLNGELALADFAFRTATPFEFAPAGVNFQLAVAPAGSTSAADAVAVFDDIMFENGKTYVVTAGGIVGNADFPFTLHVTDMAREAAAIDGNVEFAVLHGSPGAPAVDVDAFAVGNLISNLAYGEYTDDYLSVAPNAYFLNVRAAGDPNVVATFLADLNGLAGGAATVFASGLLGGEPGFGLFAALPDGTVVEFPVAPTTKVQIIHNSPSPTVDVYTNGLKLIENFAFRTATPFVDVPADVAVDVAVAPGGSASVADAIVTFEGIVFDNDKNYVVTASGIVGNDDFPFTLFVNDAARTMAANADNVEFAVLHGSPGAPAVDVDAFAVGNLISNLAYGEYTDDYLSVAPNAYFLNVRAAGDPNVVATFLADLNGLAGGAATVFASGLLGGEPGFGLFAALPDGTVVEFPVAPTTKVQIIHNSPSPTVDVYTNGLKLIENFAFRTATPFVDVPADVAVDVAVAPGGSASVADAIVTFEGIVFDNDKNYVVYANGIVGDEDFPFTLAVNDAARTMAANPNLVDVNVFHGSPGAPAVDVDARFIATLIENLAYGEFTDGYLSVPALEYLLDVRAAGDPNIVATFLAPLQGLAGSAVQVFASGLLGGEPGFGLFAALADGTVIALPFSPLADVQVVHNAIAPTVDIYANGELLIEDFAFRTATPFELLPAGTPIDLAVAPAGSTSAADAVAVFEDIVLDNGKTYIVVATGILGNTETPFGLAIFDAARTASASGEGVDLLLYHGSPDAPAVDVVVQGGGVLFGNLSFGDFSEYVNVPAASYNLDVTPAGANDNVVASYMADVSTLEGGAAFVFASGLLSGEEPAFGVWVALPDGTTFPLSLLVSTNEINRFVQQLQIAPNPVNGEAQVRFTLSEGLNISANIFNANGQLVRSTYLGNQPAGEHTLRLETGNLPQGVYHYSLLTPKGIITQRFVVVK
ncbi:MAG TPA: DUF4397 domain-containing protein [Saprospiraceae bacterium]|nr:DUF4397 domain-containing protein [Saprospiraceae bacterium]HMP22696.1 DUF4397 domain-containing protein [Saprospiraceae bacterium]